MPIVFGTYYHRTLEFTKSQFDHPRGGAEIKKAVRLTSLVLDDVILTGTSSRPPWAVVKTCSVAVWHMWRSVAPVH